MISNQKLTHKIMQSFLKLSALAALAAAASPVAEKHFHKEIEQYRNCMAKRTDNPQKQMAMCAAPALRAVEHKKQMILRKQEENEE